MGLLPNPVSLFARAAPNDRLRARAARRPRLTLEPLEERRLLAVEALPLLASSPSGWNVQQAKIDRTVTAANPQTFTLTLQAGQPLSASLLAKDSTTSFALTSPTGGVVTQFSLNAGRLGFTNHYVVPIGGTWTITIANAGTGAGNYSLLVGVNAGVEGMDTSAAAPRAIDASQTTQGTWRYAVLGTADVASGVEIDSYTVDLTSQVGRAVDFILAPRSGVNFSAQTMQLLGPSGAVVATASAGTANIGDALPSLLIRSYVVPAAGTYTIRFASNVAGDYGIVAADGTVAGMLPTSSLLSLMASQGWTTKTSVDDLLAGLTFDRVFQSFSTDELLSVLVRGGMAGSHTTLAAYKTAITAAGVNLAPFLPDGALTALATAPGGSLISSRGAPVDAAQAKTLLKSAYSANPPVFLDALTSARVIGLFDDSISGGSGAAVKGFTALATKSFGGGYDNIVYGYPLWVGGNQGNPTPQSALAATATMPLGQRTIQISDFTEIAGYYGGTLPTTGYVDPVDAQGNPQYYFLVWMDRWAQTTQARISNFFSQYKALGGQLDNVVLDVETTGLTYWDLQAYDHRVDTSTNQLPPITFWQALLQDSRWPALKAQLNAAGISDSALALDAINNWNTHSETVARWNAVAQARLASYLNQAIYQPILALFPNVRFSNFNSANRTQTIPAGAYDGVTTSYYSPGTLVGNRASRSLYGDASYVTTPTTTLGPAIPFDTRIKTISFAQDLGTGGAPLPSGVVTITFFAPVQGLRPGDPIHVENRGGPVYIDPQYTGNFSIASASADGLSISYAMPLTSATSVPASADLSSRAASYVTAWTTFWDPFNVLVSELKELRSHAAASAAPQLPWICDPTWTSTYSGYDWDHYVEMIFHAALTGADDFLWWKYSWSADTAIAGTISAALKELDPLIGYAGRKTISQSDVDWADGYVLSGMEANGQRVYRLTPDPRQSVQVLSATGSVRVQVGGRIVDIPNASIYMPATPSSTFGYWIVQTAGATNLTATPAAVLAGLQNTLRLQASSTSNVVSQPVTLSLASASTSLPSSTLFSFGIDWNGDGLIDQTRVGTNGSQFVGIYSVPGTYTIRVTPWIVGAAQSLPVVTTQVVVTGPTVQLAPNAQNAALFDLVWTGTSGADQITITQTSETSVAIQTTKIAGVAVNFTRSYSGVTGRVLAAGGAGDDVIGGQALATIPATLDGGAGSNTLFGGQAGDILIGGSNGGEGAQGNNVIIAGNGPNTIYGNAIVGAEGSTAGNNLIVGGSGADVIYGSYGSVVTKDGHASLDSLGGKNLIVGGLGTDLIYASQAADGAEGGSGSILVSGSTSLSQAGLAAVLAEWTSSRTYAERIANIAGAGAGTRANGNYFLQPGLTVLGDAAVDQLFSDAKGQLNWLLTTLAADVVNRQKAEETITPLA